MSGVKCVGELYIYIYIQHFVKGTFNFEENVIYIYICISNNQHHTYIYIIYIYIYIYVLIYIYVVPLTKWKKRVGEGRLEGHFRVKETRSWVKNDSGDSCSRVKTISRIRQLLPDGSAHKSVLDWTRGYGKLLWLISRNRIAHTQAREQWNYSSAGYKKRVALTGGRRIGLHLPGRNTTISNQMHRMGFLGQTSEQNRLRSHG